MNVGTIVQNSSKGWDSIISLSSILFLIVEIILKVTIVVINTRIVIVWSWKKISWAIRGEEAFWNLTAAHEEISKRNLFHKWGLNPVH